MDVKFKRTRLAPTPSGFLHLGNVLSFSLTAYLAQKHGAKIFLRIDDLDKARAGANYIEDIFDTLNFLDIPWDEGPRSAADFSNHYSQHYRMEAYNAALTLLAGKGQLFACECSRQWLAAGRTCGCRSKQLPLDAENVNWRLITDQQASQRVKNIGGSEQLMRLPAEMENFVVRKKDGHPAYQLASVVDDSLYGVDLVVRGADLLPSTLAQIYLAAQLGYSAFNDITFLHHPLINDSEGLKLSKSAGATSVKYLRTNGRHSEDIFADAAALAAVPGNITSWQRLGKGIIDRMERVIGSP